MTSNVEILQTKNFPYGSKSGHDYKTDTCPTVSHPKLQNKECDMKMNMPKFGIMCSLDTNISAGGDI